MTTGSTRGFGTACEDDEALAACIERVVNQLESTSTNGDRPGMLLGKIQSGKTRAFVGIIARAFDGIRYGGRVYEGHRRPFPRKPSRACGTTCGSSSKKMKFLFSTSCNNRARSQRASSDASS